MDWPTTVLGLGVCAMIAYLAGHLPGLLQDIGDTMPVANLLPADPPPPAQPEVVEALIQRLRNTEILVTRAHTMGYDKGYHDACLGIPKDPNNGSGVITWTGDTRG